MTEKGALMQLHYSKSARMSRSLIALHLFAICCSSVFVYAIWQFFNRHGLHNSNDDLILRGFIVLWIISIISVIFKCGPVAPLAILGALSPFLIGYYVTWRGFNAFKLVFYGPLFGMFLGLLLENLLFKIKQPEDPQNEKIDASTPPLPLANE
ncbi:hypothetical protein [uncultured Rubinisphaera sp.]|uniref:hypothetical protein n=1 Tax=uncultured Rubinisphaera sp. TaxID=1678686 RepID=UPI0030D9F775